MAFLPARITWRTLPLRAFCSRSQGVTDPLQPKRFLPATRKQMYEGILQLVPDSPPNSRILRIGLLGLPGVGKSSLVNRLALFQACATSQKVNTTRSKQNVAYTQGASQLIFLDLPGIMSKQRSARHHLSRTLIRDPHSGIFEADIICVVVDVSNGYQRRGLEREVLQSLHFFRDKPSILVLTKTDKLGKKRAKLLNITRRLTTGVVNNVLSVRDRYARRYGKQLAGPHPQELLQRAATEQLAEAHRAKLPAEEVEAIITELEALRLEGGTGKEEEEKAEKKEEEKKEEDEEKSLEEKSTPSDIEAYFAQHPPMSRPSADLDAGDPQARLDAMDGMLAVLREQLLLRVASRAEVAHRVRRWRALEEEVRCETAWPHFREVFMVSAVTGRGVEQLRDYLLSQARPGPWAYHSSLVSDQDPHDTVRFAVYAQCLNELAQEIPYALRIEVTECEPDPTSDAVFADVALLCRTERQLKHLIGVGGSIIRKIADSATSDLEAAFGVKVHLRLKAKLATIPKAHLKAMKKAKDFREVFPES